MWALRLTLTGQLLAEGLCCCSPPLLDAERLLDEAIADRVELSPATQLQILRALESSRNEQALYKFFEVPATAV